MLIHQSDLGAMSRCMAEYGYKRAGMPASTNSRAVYGSVMHHAIQAGERALATGTSRSVVTQQALETFAHYWNPAHVEDICEPVPPDGWLGLDKYGSLREKGLAAIRKYFEITDFDDIELLGTEFGFVVPIAGTWDEELEEPHYLAGSIDRLVVRHFARKPVVGVDDWKTAKEYRFLRQNLQGTAYCYATTRPEFWVGHQGEDGFGQQRGEELFERFTEAGRRFRWIDLKNFKFMEGGWRGPNDYARFALAVEQFASLVKNETYPMSIVGEVCKYCDFRKVCGGTGIPDEDHGKPGSTS